MARPSSGQSRPPAIPSATYGATRARPAPVEQLDLDAEPALDRGLALEVAELRLVACDDQAAGDVHLEVDPELPLELLPEADRGPHQSEGRPELPAPTARP